MGVYRASVRLFVVGLLGLQRKLFTDLSNVRRKGNKKWWPIWISFPFSWKTTKLVPLNPSYIIIIIFPPSSLFLSFSDHSQHFFHGSSAQTKMKLIYGGGWIDPQLGGYPTDLGPSLQYLQRVEGFQKLNGNWFSMQAFFIALVQNNILGCLTPSFKQQSIMCINHSNRFVFSNSCCNSQTREDIFTGFLLTKQPSYIAQ